MWKYWYLQCKIWNWWSFYILELKFSSHNQLTNISWLIQCNAAKTSEVKLLLVVLVMFVWFFMINLLLVFKEDVIHLQSLFFNSFRLIKMFSFSPSFYFSRLVERKTSLTMSMKRLKGKFRLSSSASLTSQISVRIFLNVFIYSGKIAQKYAPGKSKLNRPVTEFDHK